VLVELNERLVVNRLCKQCRDQPNDRSADEDGDQLVAVVNEAVFSFPDVVFLDQYDSHKYHGAPELIDPQQRLDYDPHGEDYPAERYCGPEYACVKSVKPPEDPGGPSCIAHFKELYFRDDPRPSPKPRDIITPNPGRK